MPWLPLYIDKPGLIMLIDWLNEENNDLDISFANVADFTNLD